MQQQQSNMVKPQKVGEMKKGKKVMKSKKKAKLSPSFASVGKSVAKTMGYGK